ncbi:FAD-dependent oxidoreductase [Breznakiella homolactica]|uniref:FAD-dependent oxidoreductase n=1 Tax=Breznakiella homolactica TaxID=2798577 RepID=A0A7T7XRS6_9SPIR|nr:FAD-dependent oxidoreductase [Breznakiella homolactica]QQO11273.1 FAD-dependent oxidoreductase [Breznakiella homolactica]
MSKNVSRRKFLKGTAMAAAAGAVTISCATTGTGTKGSGSGTLPKSWDQEADVVVVGAGGAGLMAAIQAYDAGASVAVIDKSASSYLSATVLSGGLFTASGTKIQKQQNVSDSAEQFAVDAMEYGGYMNFPHIVKVWTENSGAAFDWMADHGLAEFFLEAYAGHTNLRAVRQKTFTGKDYIDVLDKEAKARNIPVQLNTALVRFFFDKAANRVVGIEASSKSGNFTIKAKKAVILASGGITGSAETLDAWVPSVAGAGVAVGAKANDGAALMAAVRDVAVPISHMQYIASYPWGVVTDGRNGVACRFQYFCQNGGILVNKKGVRFISEETGLTKISTELPKQEEKCHFLLADQATWDETFKKYEVGTLFSMPSWSMDKLNAEFAKEQVVFKADSLADIARKAGIPAQALADTVSSYNRMVQAKDDTLFKRQNLPRQIGAGPYYMVRMSFWNNLSLGGVRLNEKLQVMDAENNPVQGFYAAGEVVAGVSGASYCGGNAISWAHTSGYLAGKNAALES